MTEQELTVSECERLARKFADEWVSLVEQGACDCSRLESLHALIAYASAVEADKRRLDWLEAEDRRVLQRPLWNHTAHRFDSRWCVGGTRNVPEGFDGETLREAIDAAMSPSPETPSAVARAVPE